MAVGLEWAHAECLGQGQGMPVGGCGWLDIRRVAMRRNLAEEPQGVGFVAPFLVRPSECESALRLGARLVQPAGEKQKARGRHASGRGGWSAGVCCGVG